MNQTFFILTRAIHFSACLLAFAAVAMDLLVMRSAVLGIPRARILWRSILRWLLATALAVALLSGAAWLAFVAMEMSDLPYNEAVRPAVLSLVWSQTHFGHLWQIRSILWAATVALAITSLWWGRHSCLPFSVAEESFLSRSNEITGRMPVPPEVADKNVCPTADGNVNPTIDQNPQPSLAPLLAMSALLSATLAWSGHGQTNGPVAWHLSADVIHILAGGFWPAGLVPLLAMLFASRRLAIHERTALLRTTIRRFSMVSLVAVGILALSGIANTWFLLGPLGNFYRTRYGLILEAKILVFVLMIMLGARNLLKWKPRVDKDDDASAKSAIKRIHLNVFLETMLAAAVMLLVGGLGISPPPVMDMPPGHHHHEAGAPNLHANEVSLAREALP